MLAHPVELISITISVIIIKVLNLGSVENAGCLGTQYILVITVSASLGSSRPVYSDKFLFDGTTIDELFIAKEISENQSKGEMIRLQEKLGWKTLQGPVIFEKNV